jgi:hypothetical protein
VVLVIGVLFVAIVLLAVVLFFLRQEPSHQERMSGEPPVVGPGPGITPVIKPRIVLRKRPAQNGKFRRREIAETTLTRKQILGNHAVGLPQAQPNGTPVVPLEPNHIRNGNFGPKIRTREIKIELDDICKVSGIAIRECPCLECQEMRANVGS